MCNQNLTSVTSLSTSRLLDLDDLLTGTFRGQLIDQPFDPFHQQSPVPGTVKDGHAAGARDERLEPPEKDVSELFGRRRTDRHDADITRVDTRGQAANSTAFTGGVEAFEEHQSPVRRCWGREDGGGKVAVASNDVVPPRPVLGLGPVHRREGRSRRHGWSQRHPFIARCYRHLRPFAHCKVAQAHDGLVLKTSISPV